MIHEMRNIPLHFHIKNNKKKYKEEKKRGMSYEVDTFLNLLFINITILYIQHITHEKSFP